METLFTYFLKANGLLITFFLAYYFLLRKETFFNKNRWFLVFGLLTSVLLPLITFTKTVWIEPSPVVYEPISYESIPYVLVNQIEKTPFDWNSFFIYAYLFVATVFLVKMIIELFSFFRIIRFGNRTKLDQTILIDTNQNTNPFSFFKYIVYNKEMFNEEDLLHIISHESIHVKEKHSIDVLLGKVFCAIFWINPIMWFYRKEMLQNLEYIADNKASFITQNRINYQKTLLKVVTHQHQLSITNQFYQSLIKKRIVMLNTNQSNQRKSWKYVLILPVLSAFMLLFQVETVAQVREETSKMATYAVSESFSSTLTKNTTDKELKELEKTFSNENRKLIISDVKRNKKGEIIEIKLLFDTGNTYHRVLHRRSNESIDDIQIFVKTDEKGNKNCGFIETDEELGAFMEANEGEIFAVPINDKSETYWSMDNMKKNGKDVVLIIKGKIKGATEKVKIPMNEELGEMKEISATDFEKKYKQKAVKNKLYYEVETVKVKVIVASWDEAKKITDEKKNKLEEEKVQSGYGIAFETETFPSENNIKKIKEDKKVDFQKALFIYDGKEISREDYEKIDPSIIASLSVLKSENAIEKYGAKGKNGVIEIKSQKYLEKTDPIYKEIKNNKDRKEAELNAKQNLNLSDEEIETRYNERKKLIEERKKVLEEKKAEREKEFDKRENLLKERKEEYEKRKKVIEEKREKLKEEKK